MRIGDHTLNRLKVLKAILRHGPVSRTQLPGLTGLSAGLITQLTSEMVQRSLIRETKIVSTGKGRPRVLLEMNADGPVVIGASIGWSATLEAAFVDLSGKVLHVAQASLPDPASLAGFAQNLGHALAQAIAESPIPPQRIARVGLALPALIDSDKGEVHFNTTLAAGPTAIADPISQILGLPITLENELDCMARAEHWFGRARDVEDFSLFRIGSAIDCAEFASGVPRFGSTGLSSSFGHVKIAQGEQLRPCYCGAQGCLTLYASSYGILEAAGELIDLPFPPVEQLPTRFAAYVTRAGDGDLKASENLETAAEQFGLALANYLNTVNPAHVFIAVDNHTYLNLLRERLATTLKRCTMPGVLPLTRIEFIQTSRDWRWTGTAALALERVYVDEGNIRKTANRPNRTSNLALSG